MDKIVSASIDYCGVHAGRIEQGYTPSVLLMAKAGGDMSLGEAKEWLEAGYSNKDVAVYKDAGMSADEAFDWEMAGFTAAQASRARKDGISLDEARGSRRSPR